MQEFRARGRMRVAGTEPRLSTAVDQFYREIYEHIEAGGHGIGSTLPKVQYVAARRGVSNHTVSRAYHRLAEKGLVHRRGRSWVVGSAAHLDLPRTATQPSVIFVLLAGKRGWTDLAVPRTEAFGRRRSELPRAGRRSERRIAYRNAQEHESGLIEEEFDFDACPSQRAHFGISGLASMLLSRLRKRLAPTTQDHSVDEMHGFQGQSQETDVLASPVLSAVEAWAVFSDSAAGNLSAAAIYRRHNGTGRSPEHLNGQNGSDMAPGEAWGVGIEDMDVDLKFAGRIQRVPTTIQWEGRNSSGKGLPPVGSQPCP